MRNIWGGKQHRAFFTKALANPKNPLFNEVEPVSLLVIDWPHDDDWIWSGYLGNVSEKS